VWDEDSGLMHRRLEGFGAGPVNALASFLSPDGQSVRLVAGSFNAQLWVYNPEAGSVLHRLRGHTERVVGLACIASSSAAPHHSRLVSASADCTAKVWDGETGERLADLEGHGGTVACLAVWKEHTGGHDRIATASYDGEVKIWDGEAFTLLHDFDCGLQVLGFSAFKSAEGPTHLLVALADARGLQVWDPEEGRLLHDGINRGCPVEAWSLTTSPEGRQLLAVAGKGAHQPQHYDNVLRAVLEVWDLGEVPDGTRHLRGAHKQG
jgi:WD40 repeat protein